MRHIKHYGWIPDLPDRRDFRYTPSVEKVPPPAVLPESVDLRPNCPDVYDQGQLGSYTANAIAGAMHFDELKQQQPNPFVPSRLFIYYNERVIEGTVDYDSGAELRDGIKVVSSQGICPETEWPYYPANLETKPLDSCYSDATQYEALAYYSLDNTQLDALKTCLAAGYPFVFGFTVYDSFESNAVATTGIMPMPGADEGVVGGHAVMSVGYDNSKNWFVVRNSWGSSWGDAGYFYMPYGYIVNSNLASDFWTIRTIS